MVSIMDSLTIDTIERRGDIQTHSSNWRSGGNFTYEILRVIARYIRSQGSARVPPIVIIIAFPNILKRAHGDQTSRFQATSTSTACLIVAVIFFNLR